MAGAPGLHRVVQRLNVMTVPDILPWVKENEFLLATGYPLPSTAAELAALVSALDARGLAALGVKLGSYLEALPREMLQRADQLAFPIIDIPQHVGFDDILSQALTDIVNRQSAVLERAEEIHRVFMRIVLEGGGLPEITEKLSQLIEGAVVVLDDDGRVLAASGLAEVAGLLATAGLLGEDGRIVVGDALVPQTLVLASGGVRCALAPVLAGSMRHGRILAIEGERPLQHDALIALERAATVIALDAAKQLAVTAVERKFQSDFLHELLSGRVRNEREILSRSRSLGWDLDRPLAVVVAELERAPDEEPSGPEEHRLRARLTDAWTSAPPWPASPPTSSPSSACRTAKTRERRRSRWPGRSRPAWRGAAATSCPSGSAVRSPRRSRSLPPTTRPPNRYRSAGASTARAPSPASTASACFGCSA